MIKSTDIKILPEGQFLSYLWNLEHTQGNPDTAGWKEAGFDDSVWMNAKPYLLFEVHAGISPGNLMKRPIPLMYEQEKNFKDVFCIRKSSKTQADWEGMLDGKARVQIAPHQHEIIEISTGEMTTGFLQLKITGGRNSKIKILSAEAYVYPQDDSNALQLSVKKGDRCDFRNGVLLGY